MEPKQLDIVATSLDESTRSVRLLAERIDEHVAAGLYSQSKEQEDFMASMKVDLLAVAGLFQESRDRLSSASLSWDYLCGEGRPA